MKQIILTSGIPASGKSTWSKEFVKANPSFKRINKDSLREMIDCSAYSKNNEELISKIQNQLISTFIKNGNSIVIDNTHVKKSFFNDIKKFASSLKEEIEISEKLFHIDIDEAIERDNKREAKVGEDVIRKMFKVFNGGWEERKEVLNKIAPSIPVNSCSGQDEQAISNSGNLKTKASNNESLPRAIIVDNDGTISFLNGRSPYDASTCDNDLPNMFVINLVKRYYKDGYKIIFVSGRQEKYREPTVRFYDKYLPELKDYSLLMRKNSDFRSDDIIKKEIFFSEIDDNYNVELVLDDRLRVCKMWHEIGLNLLRVGDPEANF